MRQYIKLIGDGAESEDQVTIYAFEDDGPLSIIKSYRKTRNQSAFHNIESAVAHWKHFEDLEFDILTEREVFLELL